MSDGMTALLIGLLSSASATASPGVVTPTTSLILEPGADLYPNGASAERAEADVPINIIVDASGAMRCTSRAGPATLRRPSCELVAARDIFTPRIVSGKPESVEYTLVVRWSPTANNQQFGGAIPIGRTSWVRYQDIPQITNFAPFFGKVDVSFDIMPSGLISNCRDTRNTTAGALVGTLCPILTARALFLPSLDADGKPEKSRGHVKVDWEPCRTRSRQDCPSPVIGR